MHIADVEKGNLGATGIVGSGIPITSAALGCKLQKNDKVVLCFLAMERLILEPFMSQLIWQLFSVFL